MTTEVGFSGPYALVSDNFASFQSYALQGFGLARDAFSLLGQWDPPNLKQIQPDKYNFEVPDGDFSTPSKADIIKPEYKPPTVNLDSKITTRIDSKVDPIRTRLPGDFRPTVRPGTAPKRVQYEDPKKVIVKSVNVPDNPPTLDKVPEPQLVDIRIPTLPTIDFPDFNLQLPTWTGPDSFTNTFNYKDETFSSDVQPLVENKLKSILEGTTQTGLPAAVEQALFDRAQEREEQSFIAARDTTYDEFARRGFDLPGGLMAGRLDQLNRERLLARQTLSREILIQMHTQEIENLRFYTDQSVRYLATLYDNFNQAQARILDAAKYAFETTVATFRARIELYNGRVQGYEAAARAYAERINAETARIQAYRAQIAAEEAKATVNRSLVDAYTAQVNAQRARIETFVAEVDAARTQIEAENGKVQNYIAQIEAQRARLQAYGTEVQAYATQWNAFSAEAQAYNAQANATAALIRGEADINGVKAQIAQIQGAVAGRELAAIQAEARVYESQVNSETARLSSESQYNQAQIAYYQAQGTLASNRARAMIAAAEASNSAADAEARIALQQSALTQQAMIEARRTLLSAHETMAQASSAITSSAMAAIGVQASVSGSTSQSFNYEL